MPDRVPLIVAHPVPVGQTSVYVPVWATLLPSGPVPVVCDVAWSVFYPLTWVSVPDVARLIVAPLAAILLPAS